MNGDPDPESGPSFHKVTLIWLLIFFEKPDEGVFVKRQKPDEGDFVKRQKKRADDTS